jgi:hypothetical protein
MDNYYNGGILQIVQRAISAPTSGSTDAVFTSEVSSGSTTLVAIPGLVYLITSITASCGATATTLVFNSKGSGAGTAISSTFTLGINNTYIWPHNTHGWFQTSPNQTITCTTGTGSTVNILISYVTISQQV